MIRNLIKLSCGLVTLVVLVVIGILLFLDPIARTLITAGVRNRTGLDAKIGHVEIGLLRPTLRIENFTLYQPAEAGGGPLLQMPELYIEYDRAAARQREMHLRLIRLNISDITIVEDAAPATNLFSNPAVLDQFKISTNTAQSNRRSSSEIRFTGIDTLNLTLGRLHKTRRRNPGASYDVNLGISNEVITNIHSLADLLPSILNIAMRVGAPASPMPVVPAVPPTLPKKAVPRRP